MEEEDRRKEEEELKKEGEKTRAKITQQLPRRSDVENKSVSIQLCDLIIQIVSFKWTGLG